MRSTNSVNCFFSFFRVHFDDRLILKHIECHSFYMKLIEDSKALKAVVKVLQKTAYNSSVSLPLSSILLLLSKESVMHEILGDFISQSTGYGFPLVDAATSLLQNAKDVKSILAAGNVAEVLFSAIESAIARERGRNVHARNITSRDSKRLLCSSLDDSFQSILNIITIKQKPQFSTHIDELSVPIQQYIKLLNALYHARNEPPFGNCNWLGPKVLLQCSSKVLLLLDQVDDISVTTLILSVARNIFRDSNFSSVVAKKERLKALVNDHFHEKKDCGCKQTPSRNCLLDQSFLSELRHLLDSFPQVDREDFMMHLSTLKKDHESINYNSYLEKKIKLLTEEKKKAAKYVLMFAGIGFLCGLIMLAVLTMGVEAIQSYMYHAPVEMLVKTACLGCGFIFGGMVVSFVREKVDTPLLLSAPDILSILRRNPLKIKTGQEVVRAVCFSRDGSSLAVGMGKFVRVYDSTTTSEKKSWTCVGRVNFLQFSHDDSYLATASGSDSDPDNSALELWNLSIDPAQSALLLKESKNVVNSVAFNHDSSLLAAGCNYLIVWKYSETSKRFEVQFNKKDPIRNPTVLSVAFGLFLASGSDEGVVTIWSTTTGHPIHQFAVHQFTAYTGLNPEKITALTFNHDGAMLACGTSSGSILIHHFKTTVVKAHGNRWVFGLRFSKDSKYLVSCSGDNSIAVWDPLTGVELQRHNWHKDRVLEICFSSDGLKFASGSADKTINIW